MQPKLKIAITGKMRSGKDTVARLLGKAITEKFDVQVMTYAFGTKLKALARELYPDKFEGGNKPREIIQWLGQTLRERDEKVWINLVDKDIKSDILTYKAHINLDCAIITDLRQPNEYDYCRNNGYYIIKVDCDDAVRIKRMEELSDNFDITDLTHETEQHIDTFEPDFTINTTYTDEHDLTLLVNEIVNKIKIKEEKAGN